MPKQGLRSLDVLAAPHQQSGKRVTEAAPSDVLGDPGALGCRPDVVFHHAREPKRLLALHA